MDWRTTLSEIWARTNKPAVAAFVVGFVFGLLI